MSIELCALISFAYSRKQEHNRIEYKKTIQKENLSKKTNKKNEHNAHKSKTDGNRSIKKYVVLTGKT